MSLVEKCWMVTSENFYCTLMITGSILEKFVCPYKIKEKRK